MCVAGSLLLAALRVGGNLLSHTLSTGACGEVLGVGRDVQYGLSCQPVSSWFVSRCMCSRIESDISTDVLQYNIIVA